MKAEARTEASLGSVVLLSTVRLHLVEYMYMYIVYKYIIFSIISVKSNWKFPLLKDMHP